MIQAKIKVIITFGMLACCLSCSNEESTPIPPGEGNVPFQELYDQGIDSYLGTISPISSVEVAPGVTEHTFSSADGPVCFTGNEYAMTTRDGTSDNLMIFIQGGGVCSPSACGAVETGIPLIPFGILSPSDVENPTATYNVGYVPYCDGSFFMGDNEVDSDGDGTNDRFFKGIQNLSASLDVIASTYPSPAKILLTGNSAGGFGTHVALPLVRKLYPNVQIDLINDSGLGILDPGRLEVLNTYWNASAFFPASCADCIGEDGNLTDYHKYQLQQDNNLRMAYISSKQDSTVAAGLAGGGASLEAQVTEAARELTTAFPDRFHSMIAEGNAHTYIIRRFDVGIGGITVRQWVNNMVSESEDWSSITE